MPRTHIVIPYRDRLPQLRSLVPRLRRIHGGPVLIVELAPGEAFNRGAVKNAGFVLTAPAPGDTVYFHDVDVVPIAHKEYTPVSRGARHPFGHTHCLGGIVGVLASDFTAVNGFPTSRANWGKEDTVLQNRFKEARLPIDRSVFHKRFGVSNLFAELNDTGVPMTSTEARLHHMKTWKTFTGPAPTGGLAPPFSFTVTQVPQPWVHDSSVSHVRISLV